jgi:hypothetical protein
MTPLPEAVMKHAPWSYSKASDALTCPLKFHKKYIKRERAMVPEARETTVGTVVHKILEWTDMGMSIDEAFRKAAESMDFTYEVGLEVQTFRGAVEEWVQGLAQFCTKHRVLKKYPEKKIGLDQHFMITGYDDKTNCLVRGKIDLTLFTGHRRGVVIDHKSGAFKKIEYHQDQLELYSIMADALVKGLVSVRAALHFIGADKNANGKRTTWLPEYSVEVVRTHFIQKWTELLIRATAVAEDPDPQPKACWLCNFCGYTAVCPLKA